MNFEKITLKKVESQDYRFLFNLLKERDPKTNISHKKMPTFSEHVKFIESKPYTNWYIVKSDKKKIGSVYLSKNDEIGIFLKKEVHGKNVGKIVLDLLFEKNPRDRYLANVNPKNIISSKFFKKNGFKLIQHTYELEIE